MGSDYPTLGDRRRQEEEQSRAAARAVWEYVELPRERHRKWLEANPMKLDETSVVIPPPGPQVSSGFTLFPKPRGREEAGSAVDELLAKHGIR